MLLFFSSKSLTAVAVPSRKRVCVPSWIETTGPSGKLCLSTWQIHEKRRGFYTVLSISGIASANSFAEVDVDCQLLEALEALIKLLALHSPMTVIGFKRNTWWISLWTHADSGQLPKQTDDANGQGQQAIQRGRRFKCRHNDSDK